MRIKEVSEGEDISGIETEEENSDVPMVDEITGEEIPPTVPSIRYPPNSNQTVAAERPTKCM